MVVLKIKCRRTFEYKMASDEPSDRASVVNVYKLLEQSKDPILKPRKHYNPDPHMPQHPFRMLVVSASGGGKTNAIVGMIDKWGCFKRIDILTCIHEPLYDLLVKQYPKQVRIFYSDAAVKAKNKSKGVMESKTSSGGDQGASSFPLPEEQDDKDQRLVIFDDQNGIKSSQALIESYFKFARRKNISSIYIAQSYYTTPSFIRKQLSHLVMLRVSGKRDLGRILQEVATDLDDKMLQKLYNDALERGKSDDGKMTGYLMIYLMEHDVNKKYRYSPYHCYKIKSDESEHGSTE